MARRTKAEIAREKAVDAACNAACLNLQIPIFKLGDIAKAAEKAYDEGKTEEEMRLIARQCAEQLAAA
jgi:hypothetical protein